jgi:hypothetical protein
MRRLNRAAALGLSLLATGLCLAQGQGEVWEDVTSTWRDGVHTAGIAGGALAVLALVLGIVIYAGPRLPGKKLAPALRKRLRTAHMACGMAAALLALTHHVWRLVQVQQLGLGHTPPHLAGYGFLLLLLTGALRARPPKALRKAGKWFARAHRLALVVAFVSMGQHALREFDKFSR